MRHDIVVIGAGIVGLATAYRLLEDDPSLRVVVLDKERRVGAHQSTHNSGVLHAGVYYAPGSRKAELCTEGKAAMQEFADTHDIPWIQNGKVIVAVDHAEVPRLDALEARARANGVPGLTRLDAAGLAELEPNVAGVAAIHSPTTGSIDYGRVCVALAREITDRGGELALGAAVTAIDERADGVTVTTTATTWHSERVVACAGVQSDRVARLSGADPAPKVVPFRGSWLVLRRDRSDLVNGHVYPVPDPQFPFLGVHLSPRVDGEVWIGPNAVLASGRESYDRNPDLGDLAAVAATGPFWRFAARNWRIGAVELWRDRNRESYLRTVRRYVPAITAEDILEERPTGIRAQSLDAEGHLVDDFVFQRVGRVLHVRNAPSPAATASLAIGRVVAAEVRAART